MFQFIVICIFATSHIHYTGISSVGDVLPVRAPRTIQVWADHRPTRINYKSNPSRRTPIQAIPAVSSSQPTSHQQKQNNHSLQSRRHVRSIRASPHPLLPPHAVPPRPSGLPPLPGNAGPPMGGRPLRPTLTREGRAGRRRGSGRGCFAGE